MALTLGCGGVFVDGERICIESREGFVGLGEFFEGFGFFLFFLLLLFGKVGFGGGAADGFDAADAGGDGAFGFDFEKADVFGVGDVCAAAEFHGIAVEGFVAAADLDDANEVAVFVAEELHDVGAVLDPGM